MIPPNQVIESYLDELLGTLHGRPAAVRRMLSETEEHLYAAVADGESRGLDRDAAAQEALARFGQPDQVAREWNAQPPTESLPALCRRLAGELAPLVGVGLLSVGLSGVLARIMAALWGLRFMFADPSGTQYSAGECRYWMSIHPDARNCTAAYLNESLADGTQVRYVAGVLGIALLGLVVVIRRHRGIRILAGPTPVTTLAAAGAFALAGLALVALGVNDLRLFGGNGAGQWLSGAVVALPLALLYGWQFVHVERRSPAAC